MKSTKNHNKSYAEIEPVENPALIRKMKYSRMLEATLPFAGLIFIFIFFLISTRGGLVTRTNLSNIMDQLFTTLIVSVGAVFVYAHGGFDMSLAAISGVAQMAMAMLIIATDSSLNPLVVLLTGLAITVGLSVINAVVHLKLRVPIFVVTLCMSFACTGILINAVEKSNISIPFVYLENFNSTSVRVAVLAIVVAVCWVLFEKTKIGKSEKVIGGSRVVAAQSGINVDKYVILAFAITGICVGLASFFLLSRTNRVSGSAGGNMQLNIMIAIVLGGMPLSGGAASRISAAIVGTVSVTILTNGLTLMGVDISMINAIKGILFVIIVAISYKRSTDGLVT